MATQPIQSVGTWCITLRVRRSNGLTAFDSIDTRSFEGLLQVPELTFGSDQRQIVDGQEQPPMTSSFKAAKFVAHAGKSGLA